MRLTTLGGKGGAGNSLKPGLKEEVKQVLIERYKVWVFLLDSLCIGLANIQIR